MIPKPVFVKLKAYVRKLQEDYASETEGKTGLAAVPVDVGMNITRWLEDNHIRREEAAGVCEYLVKQGMLAVHPWGGYMVPPSKNAPVIPPKTDAKKMVTEVLDKLSQ